MEIEDRGMPFGMLMYPKRSEYLCGVNNLAVLVNRIVHYQASIHRTSPTPPHTCAKCSVRSRARVGVRGTRPVAGGGGVKRRRMVWGKRRDGDEEEEVVADAEPSYSSPTPHAHRKGREVGWGSQVVWAVCCRYDGED